jgi:hypothetical protein
VVDGRPAHDEATIAYCQAHGIHYNAFGVEKNCPFGSAAVAGLAAKYRVSAGQVCGRWALQRVGSAAMSSGCDPLTAPVRRRPPPTRPVPRCHLHPAPALARPSWGVSTQRRVWGCGHRISRHRTSICSAST